MQSQDQHGNVIGLEQFEKLSEIQDRITKAEEKGAVSFRIGRLPKRLHRFTLLGMLYEVTFVDEKRAKIQAKMVDGNETMINSGVEVAGELAATNDTLHSISTVLAKATMLENAIPEGHKSWVTQEELPDLKFPKGKVIKVSVTWVDEAEIIPPA